MTRVVIAGGGVGALEAALALRALSAGSIDVTMVSPAPRFVYRPWSVTTAFGRGAAAEVDLKAVADERGFEFVQAAVTALDDAASRVQTDAGPIDYDACILAVGARQVPVVRGALTFRGPQDTRLLAEALTPDRLPDGSRVAFVTTASSVWSLPAYELAMLTAAEFRTAGRRVRVTLVTGELFPLQDFGRAVSLQVAAALRDHGVELMTHTVPETYEDGSLYVPMAGGLLADLAVALPGLAGRRLEGLPADALGFVGVDDFGRVLELDGPVYAIGDMTARQLKQGGLTTQQADVAAAAIAQDAGLPVAAEPYEPVLRAMLLTGGEPLWLRHPPKHTDRPAVGAPWWPPHKIAGVHLGNYLATHGELIVTPR